MNFEELKNKILEQAKKESACSGSYRDACNATNEEELLDVIIENINWCVKHKVATGEILGSFDKDILLQKGIYIGHKESIISDKSVFLFDSELDYIESAPGSKVNTISLANSTINAVRSRENSTINEVSSWANSTINAVSSWENSTINAVSSRENSTINAVSSRENSTINAVRSRENSTINEVRSWENSTINAVSSRENSTINEVRSRENSTINAVRSRENSTINEVSSWANSTINEVSSRENSTINAVSSRENSTINAVRSRENSTIKIYGNEPKSIEVSGSGCIRDMARSKLYVVKSKFEIIQFEIA